MSGEKTILLILTLIFLGLIFVNPAGLNNLGNFLTFGNSPVNRLSAEEFARKFKELRAGVNANLNAKFVSGDIYSRYPLNFKNELLIDAGKKDGVKTGGAALWNGILVGRVIQADEDNSLVQTIFDPNFSVAARIGKSGTDALLKGGVEPKLTLIMPKGAEIKTGEAVYSASRDFAYGLPIGTIGPAAANLNGIFFEADLELTYNPSDLRYLFLEKQ